MLSKLNVYKAEINFQAGDHTILFSLQTSTSNAINPSQRPECDQSRNKNTAIRERPNNNIGQLI